MKKTLFAVAALALCGTAFADTFSITTSQLKANNKKDFSSLDFGVSSDVTLIVDQSMAFDSFSTYDAKSLSLKFEGEATAISVGGYGEVQKVVAVSGDSVAATYWAKQLLSATEEPAVITLVSGASTVSFKSTTFMGESKTGTVTLGDTEVTYLGTYTSMAMAKNAITETNQVALVRGGSSDNYTLAIVGKATVPTTNDEALKSMTETRTDVAALVNSAADFMATTGVQQAKLAAKVAALAGKDGAAPFVAMGGSSMRYNTGSHVDADGFNGALGVAKAFDDITLGVAGEYGISSYKSYVGSTSAKGNSKLYGAALLADWQGKQGWHAEGAVRLGRTSTDYSAMTALGHKHYSDHASYQGIMLGGGKEIKVSRKCDDTVDLYARYMYSHTNGSNTTATSGEAMHFSAVDSHRTMVGARYNHELSDSAVVYAGAAWMHEFNGDAHSVIGGFTAPSPSLEGDSGMVEIGTTFAPMDSQNVLINLNVQGWTGVQRGISGGAGCTIKF